MYTKYYFNVILNTNLCSIRFNLFLNYLQDHENFLLENNGENINLFVDKIINSAKKYLMSNLEILINNEFLSDDRKVKLIQLIIKCTIKKNINKLQDKNINKIFTDEFISSLNL